VKNEVVDTIEEFFTTVSFRIGLSKTDLVLIPKKKDASPQLTTNLLLSVMSCIMY